MKRQVKPSRKRRPASRLQPKRSLILKAKAQIINFAVIGDSHVGYGNSSSIFRNLLPKAVNSGNKRFLFLEEIIRKRELIMEIMRMLTTRISRIR